MNIFKRIFKIGEAQANRAVDNQESPIIMTEQGIREMKEELHKSVEAMAQLKALAIRSKNEYQEQEAKAKDYESEALLILKKAQAGEMEAADADRLAKEALAKKEAVLQRVNKASVNKEKLDQNVSQLKDTVHTIEANITIGENELRTLTAREKVNDATKNVKKQMAELDSAGTVSMLERMKKKEAQEVEADADTSGTKLDDDLAKLKEQLGIKKKEA